MIRDGIPNEGSYFKPPSHFDAGETSDGLQLIVDSDGNPVDETYAIFLPIGGAAVFDRPRPNLMAEETMGSLVFGDLFKIENNGISMSASPDGNDLVAFFPRVNRSACKQFNDSACAAGSKTDVDGIPTGLASPVSDINFHTMLKLNAPGFDSDERARIGGAFAGRACGRYNMADADLATSGPYIYFHAVLER
jgi:hypothetical protein